jgi:hypothetical protein
MNPILNRLNRRRSALTQRLELLEERDRRGEGSTTWLELELLEDELEHIHDLMRTMLMMAIARNAGVVLHR